MAKLKCPIGFVPMCVPNEQAVVVGQRRFDGLDAYEEPLPTVTLDAHGHREVAEVQTGTRVQMIDPYGRIVFEHVFPVAAWYNPRLGFPPEGHQTTVQLVEGGRVVGLRYVYHGPGHKPVGPPPWPEPRMTLVYGPPPRKQRFNGLDEQLGLGPREHFTTASTYARSSVRLLKQAEQAIKEGRCEDAFQLIVDSERFDAGYTAHAQSLETGVAPQHDGPNPLRVNETFMRKCLRKNRR